MTRSCILALGTVSKDSVPMLTVVLADPSSGADKVRFDRAEIDFKLSDAVVVRTMGEKKSLLMSS